MGAGEGMGVPASDGARLVLRRVESTHESAGEANPQLDLGRDLTALLPHRVRPGARRIYIDLAPRLSGCRWRGPVLQAEHWDGSACLGNFVDIESLWTSHVGRLVTAYVAGV